MINILWVVLGGFIGWAGDTTMKKMHKNTTVDIIIGIIGAVLGVWVAGLFGLNGFVNFDWWSLLASFLGAVILVWIFSAFRK